MSQHQSEGRGIDNVKVDQVPRNLFPRDLDIALIRETLAQSKRLRLKRVPFWLSSTDINQGHWPVRGLICSAFFHALVLSGLIFIPPSLSFVQMPPRPLHVTMIDLKDPNYRLYLPVLHGAEPPDSVEEKEKPEPVPNETVERKANLAQGFSYPGPQPIVSDFPKPTNRIQTVLQPTLLDPPILPPPLSLPNLVQMPDAAPATRLTTSLLLNLVTPVELPPPPQPVVQPEPVLKPIELETNAVLPVTKPPMPADAAKEVPEAPVKEPAPAPQTASVAKEAESASTKPAEPLLTLSPMPALAADTVKVPLGEARGRFAISPEPNLTTSEEPGTNAAKAGTEKDKDSMAAATAGKTLRRIVRNKAAVRLRPTRPVNQRMRLRELPS